MEPIGSSAILIGNNEEFKVCYDEEKQRLILTDNGNAVIKELDQNKSDEVFSASNNLIGGVGISGGIAMESLVKGGLKSYKYTFDAGYSILGFGVGVVNDTSGDNPEPLYQAVISQAGTAATSYGINLVGVAALATVSNPVGLVLDAGVLLAASTYFGNKMDEAIDGIIEDMRNNSINGVELEFEDGISSGSMEAWRSIKGMEGDLQDLVDQGVTDINFKFGEETLTLVEMLSSPDRILPPYLTGNQEFASLKDLYDNASTARVVRRDPIVLDLDGDGLEIDPLGNGAHFALDRNGFAEERDEGFGV